MSPPHSPNLITPLEPDRSVRRPVPSAPARRVVYAMGASRLETAVASSCGRHHDVNEDTHSPLEGSGRLFVVADGVGGGAMAQLASRLLVARLHEALDGAAPDGHDVAAAMLAADRAIAEAIARVTERPGAATVALCAVLDGQAAAWLVAWVGDCRVYRWSPGAAGGIACLTRDDTFGHLGETPPAGGSLDDPARMVGNGATSGANSGRHALGHGGVLALCSDGVHKHLDEADWGRLLSRPAPLASRCSALVALARARGSSDDATLLLIERRSRDRDAAQRGAP